MFVFVFACDVYVHVCCGVETTCRLPRWLGLFHKRASYTKSNKELIKNRALCTVYLGRRQKEPAIPFQSQSHRMFCKYTTSTYIPSNTYILIYTCVYSI